MPKEDYLLKYLEKLSRMIAAMLGLRGKGLPEDALRLADETYKELLALDLENISIMPVSEFIEIVKKESYTSAYIEALAKITKETADCFELKNDSEKTRIFNEKALLLYKLLNEKDKTFSFERELIISELEKKLVR
ncbi:MAG: hypothetical protein LLF95_03370 [Bacteroidales bacterium]|nr:hypothetical protein [Bacteroidales bacterium]